MIEARRAAIESLLGQAAERPVALEIEVEAPAGSAGAKGSADAPDAATGPEAPASGEEHQLVRRAAELFKAKVVHVEPLRRPQ
jgi:hypothetical protein